jgi:hypothetical protein
METKKRIVRQALIEGGYFYQHENGTLWSMCMKDTDGGERYLLPCYLERENNRGWTFRLAYAIATTQPKAFLSRGEWELEG